MNKRILLSGASGFIGRAALKEFLGRGASVLAPIRGDAALDGGEAIRVGDLDELRDWGPLLDGVDCVVHLAARAHRLHERAADPLAAYRRTNTEVSLRLAEQAAQSGVRRFVYLSTAKIYGETSPQHSFRENDRADPQDPYALSKWEAEQGLHAVAAQSGLELCILRPPLVYGPGVGANFLRLMDYVAQRKWLPLGAVRNRRSLLGLQNLIEAICLCVTHPAAAGACFNVADEEVLSTSDLVRRLATALDVEARLGDVPPNLLRLAMKLAGRGEEVQRLLGDFVLDATALRERLDWAPRPMDSGLQATAHWYRGRRHLG